MNLRLNRRITVLVVAGELAIAAVAFACGWWIAGQPWPYGWRWSGAAVGLGAVAALPWVALAAWMASPAGLRYPAIRGVFGVTRARLGNWISSLSVSAAAAVSLAAGIGEELLFRGVLLDLLSPGPAGLVVTSILFGLLHALTVTYAVLATLMGMWLGMLQLVGGNLLVPIVAHALYDFLALLLLRRTFALHGR